MKNYKLLTPGPLTTSNSVKQEMLYDRCTWDEDYKKLTQKIRKDLLEIAGVDGNEYTTVLMQGSGSFGIESVLTSSVSDKDKVLIVSNGAYGERASKICEYIGINHIDYKIKYEMQPEVDELERILKEDKDITHVFMVHCETTTGILNPIKDVSAVIKKYNKLFILDAMSSFGAIPIDIKEMGIDFLISSSNKCIQGVPGFSLIIAKIESLMRCEGIARSLSLDLFDQFKVMDKDGKWRYTSPTHVVAAFSKALDELKEEGGVRARFDRYTMNNTILRNRLEKLQIKAVVEEGNQSPIITTFLYPTDDFDFNEFYYYLKERGFVIYPGKLTEIETFRIGNIGEIYKEDINKLCEIIEEYLNSKNNERDKNNNDNDGVKAVVFDWAGTTVDFGCFAPVNVFIEVFKEKGIDVTMDEAREPMGMLKWDHIKAMLSMERIGKLWKNKFGREFTDKDVDDLFANFEPLLLESLNYYSNPIPGVIDIAEDLRTSGIKIGSTTGYNDKMMDIVRVGAKKSGYEADYIVTPDSTNNVGRPYPFMIFKNMENFKINKTWEVVKVGDTIADIKEGINAGVWSIGKTIGSSQIGLSEEEFSKLSNEEKQSLMKKARSEFIAAGADFVIDDIVELKELIKDINALIKEGKRPKMAK